MKNKDEVIVKIHLEGEAFDLKNGYNLYYLSESLSNFQELIEKTYLHVENKIQMSADDRQNLEVRLKNIEDGSFLSDAAIVIRDMTLPMLPIIAETQPEVIWNLIKESFNFIKVILKSKEKGESPKVEMNESTNSFQVVNNTGTVLIQNVLPSTMEIASKTSGIYARMSNLVTDDDRVTSIGFEDPNNPKESIKLDKGDKKLFKKRTYLSDETITVSGTMMKVNGEALTGNLKVTESDEVSPGSYQIDFMDKELAPEILKESFLVDKRFDCFARYSFDPSTFEDTIIGLRILKIIN